MKKDGWITLASMLAALLIRLPFASHYLQHWDSVNYALSLEHYDVRLHQPHPPGYFLYSMLGKLVNLVFHDANASLVAISIVSGTLGIGALYWFGLRVLNRQAALAAVILAIASPLLWFESEVALNYALDFLLVTLTAWLFFEQRRDGKKYWFWSALVFGVTAGVRLHDLVFLGLLWLWSLIALTWKQRIFSLLVLAATCLAWLIPMAAMSGGWNGFLSAFMAESTVIGSEASFFVIDQLGLNLGRFGIYLIYGLMAAWLPLAYGAWQALHRWRQAIRHHLSLPFALWLIPAALFFVFIHIRQSGHVILLMPALFVLAGWSVSAWLEQLKRPAVGWGVVSLLGILNAVFFLAAPMALLGSNRLPLLTPSRAGIEERDQFIGTRLTAIRQDFDPARTAVVAGGLYIRNPDFYLRDFRATDLSYRLPVQEEALPEKINTLVFFDNQVFTDLENPRLQRLTLPDGSELRYLNWQPGERLWISQGSIEIRSNP